MRRRARRRQEEGRQMMTGCDGEGVFWMALVCLLLVMCMVRCFLMHAVVRD